MTPGVGVRSAWDPQELMVWAGPSLCALLLACAEARTHALQQTACAEPERPLFRRMDLWNVRSSMRTPRARNASFDQPDDTRLSRVNYFGLLPESNSTATSRATKMKSLRSPILRITPTSSLCGPIWSSAACGECSCAQGVASSPRSAWRS